MFALPPSIEFAPWLTMAPGGKRTSTRLNRGKGSKKTTKTKGTETTETQEGTASPSAKTPTSARRSGTTTIDASATALNPSTPRTSPRLKAQQLAAKNVATPTEDLQEALANAANDKSTAKETVETTEKQDTGDDNDNECPWCSKVVGNAPRCVVCKS